MRGRCVHVEPAFHRITLGECGTFFLSKTPRSLSMTLRHSPFEFTEQCLLLSLSSVD